MAFSQRKDKISLDVVADNPTRVWVVDDEPDQLETIHRGLHLYGFESTLSLSGKEALARFAAEPQDRPDVLVTDLTMPECSGFDLIARARDKWPELPIIAITGLTLSNEIRHLRQQGVGILQKPFRPDQLDEAIRRLLGS